MTSAERLRYNLAFLLILLVGGAPLIASAATYHAIDLGDLPDGIDHSVATGINIRGQVVGTSNNGAEQSGFIWESQMGMRGLSRMPNGFSAANGINDMGQVVGEHSDGSAWHAVRWDAAGGMQDIHSLVGGLAEGPSYATKINSSGQIAGWKRGGAEPYDWSPYFWDPISGVHELGGSQSLPYDMNDRGQVIGRSQVTGNWIWDVVNGMRPVPVNNVSGISNSGQVLGQTIINGVWSAYVWDSVSGIRDLEESGFDRADSRSFDMNSSGLIVGSGRFENLPGQFGTERRATIWDASGHIHDLNQLLDEPLDSNWLLTSALHINDAGQIVAEATSTSGLARYHAFLLTPVPEPASIVLLILGAIGLLPIRRLMKRGR